MSSQEKAREITRDMTYAEGERMRTEGIDDATRARIRACTGSFQEEAEVSRAVLTEARVLHDAVEGRR